MSWDRSWSRSKLSKFRRNIHFAAQSLDDDDALETVEMFPLWSGDGVQYEAGYRFRYGEKLYRVLQAHTSQPTWTPDATPSLYAEVAQPGQGDTPENPIPYAGNMALVKDKYYSQDGVVYVCTRDTEIPVYSPLSALVGLYVEIYQA